MPSKKKFEARPENERYRYCADAELGLDGSVNEMAQAQDWPPSCGHCGEEMWRKWPENKTVISYCQACKKPNEIWWYRLAVVQPVRLKRKGE